MVNDCEKPTPESIITDASGQFQFDLDENCCYTIKAAKEGYLAAMIENQCTKELSASTTLQANINLQPFTTPDDARVTKDPTTGLYIDMQTGEPAEGNINGVTYEKGEIISTDEGIYPPGKTPDEVTFLLHIYYDFNQSYIREDAVPELEKLLATLENNTDLIIEIGSHTDSRGSYRYNNRLSQRRGRVRCKMANPSEALMTVV